jgi:glycosyltransferase involved in cell wall biosynthesis
MVEDGKTGSLFESGDVAGLSGKMAGLASNPQRLLKIGRAAYDHIHKKHSPAIIRQRLLEVYQSL